MDLTIFQVQYQCFQKSKVLGTPSHQSWGVIFVFWGPPVTKIEGSFFILGALATAAVALYNISVIFLFFGGPQSPKLRGHFCILGALATAAVALYNISLL